ncbi:AAA family ATPase [Noviherbaspirillum sp. ST9]|uniref:AAA family ATPase n=1 Tax=Noviherbaspirillum sp. ST9 TaxID=3401606 RepID=UPI003B58910A
MNTLRIQVVSPNKKTLAHVAQLLQAQHGTSVAEQALDDTGNFDRQNPPDVLIVDGTGAGDRPLEVLERLGQRHPHMSFILLCDRNSPDFLLRAMRAGVREVLPATVSQEELDAALERIRFKMGFSKAHKGKVMAFVSCKGGSGATLLATNLAYALAQDGSKVALFDLNLQFGDAMLFLSDQKPPVSLSDVARDIGRLDAAFLASSMLSIDGNLSALASPDDPANATEVKPEHIDALLQLAREHYDFVVLDVGRGLDARAVKALDHADVIYPVLQTTMPYVRDGKRLLEAFTALGYTGAKVQLVLNRHQKGGEIALGDLERALGSKIARIVPNHYEATAASVNQGIPIVKLARNSPVSKALKEWSQSMTRKPEQADEGWLARMFRRPQKA